MPVPKLYAAFTKSDCMYMLMRREKGKQLGLAWDDLDEQQHSALLAELRRCWDELRALNSPYDDRVGSVNCGKINDNRVKQGGHGPYASIDDFHYNIGTANVLNDALNGKPPEATNLAQAMKTKRWQTCFTHGDFSSFNVLIKKAGTLSCVRDWEMARWLPEYYEYTSSWHGNLYDQNFFRPLLGKILEHYPQELKMDTLRRERYPVY